MDRFDGVDREEEQEEEEKVQPNVDDDWGNQNLVVINTSNPKAMTV